MAKRKSNKGFLVIALICAVLVVSVISMTLSGQTSGYYSMNRGITSDVTGAIFTCSAMNNFKWQVEYPNGFSERLGSKTISSSYVNCNPELWFCAELPRDQSITCNNYNEDVQCICRGQKLYDYPQQYLTSR